MKFLVYQGGEKKGKKQQTYLVVGSSHSRIYKMTDFLTELFFKRWKRIWTWIKENRKMRVKSKEKWKKIQKPRTLMSWNFSSHVINSNQPTNQTKKYPEDFINTPFYKQFCHVKTQLWRYWTSLYLKQCLIGNLILNL